MTPKEKAQFLVNEQYYQPLTLHLNLTNNSMEMWEYAKRCALIAAEELIISTHSYRWHKEVDWDEVSDEFTQDYWIKVKEEIQKL